MVLHELDRLWEGWVQPTGAVDPLRRRYRLAVQDRRTREHSGGSGVVLNRQRLTAPSQQDPRGLCWGRTAGASTSSGFTAARWDPWKYRGGFICNAGRGGKRCSIHTLFLQDQSGAKPHHRLPEPVKGRSWPKSAGACATGCLLSRWGTPRAKFHQLDDYVHGQTGVVPEQKTGGENHQAC